MFVSIKERKQGPRIVLSLSVLLCAFISLHLVDASNYKARLSGRLAQTICTATAKHGASKKIQEPLEDDRKLSICSEPSCKAVKWNSDCESEGSCEKFECDSSAPSQMSTRIVGGVDAKPNEFPYQVYFKRPSFFCGGSVLTATWVITAAHCFFGQESSYLRYTVVAGGHDRNSGSAKEQERNIKKVIIHEDYNHGPEYNDITLIEVDPPFDLNTDVQPVVLPRPDYVACGNTIVSGWGTMSSGGRLADVLQKVTVPLITNEECAAAYNGKEEITSTMICAGFVGVGGKDACQGDSGGPLTSKLANGSFLLVGVVSWGLFCADARYPGVYTEVAKFVDWINENAK